MSLRPIVYSDLNCPFCFALNEWLHDLGHADAVEWVGIEHMPQIPIGRPVSSAHQAAIDREMASITRRAPAAAVKRPPIRSNSKLALGLVALAEERFPDHAVVLRTALFRALWHEGCDIADRDVLRAVLRACDLPVAPEDGRAYAPTVARQTEEWRATMHDRIPLITAPSGTLYLGLGDRRALEIFLGSALFDIDKGGTCRV